MSSNYEQSNTTWRCTSCDTLNTGETCSICGASKPYGGSARIIEKKQLSMADENKYYLLLLEAKQFREKEQYVDELRTLLSAAEIDDSSYEIWFDLGVSFFNNEIYERAIACFSKAGDMGDRRYEVWNDRGVSYARLGNYAEAKKCYEKALTMVEKGTSEYALVLGNYGLQVGRLGDLQRAAQILNEAEHLGRDVTSKRKELGL